MSTHRIEITTDNDRTPQRHRTGTDRCRHRPQRAHRASGVQVSVSGGTGPRPPALPLNSFLARMGSLEFLPSLLSHRIETVEDLAATSPRLYTHIFGEGHAASTVQRRVALSLNVVVPGNALSTHVLGLGTTSVTPEGSPARLLGGGETTPTTRVGGGAQNTSFGSAVGFDTTSDTTSDVSWVTPDRRHRRGSQGGTPHHCRSPISPAGSAQEEGGGGWGALLGALSRTRLGHVASSLRASGIHDVAAFINCSDHALQQTVVHRRDAHMLCVLRDSLRSDAGGSAASTSFSTNKVTEPTATAATTTTFTDGDTVSIDIGGDFSDYEEGGELE